MALFKISKGLKANLPITKTEGYCWYTTDDSLFYIDYKDSNGTLQRKAINAKDAETLTGANLSTILSSSDIEIPTSKAVLDKLDEKVDKITGKGLSTNDYTTVEKEKLAAIEEGANKTIVDTSLSSTSTNPVQNKVVDTKFSSIQTDIDSKVPNTRTINGKALSTDITLSASDVSALPDTTVIPSIEGLATETYVDNKVAGLVDSAPAALDTLNELAQALGEDPNFATTITNEISKKVDKITGKGLSTNDYTTDEKNKLSNIEAGAQVNVIESIKANGATLAITNKIVTIPTPNYPVKSVNGELGEIVLNDVKYTSQDLTSQQKSEARTNIGAGTSNVMVTLKTWTSSDVG